MTTALAEQLKRMHHMHLMVEGIGPVSVADLAELGATFAERSVRDDTSPTVEQEPPGVADPVDVGECATDAQSGAETAEVDQGAETDVADEDDRQQRLLAQLDALDARSTAMDERTTAIEAALAADDVEALAALMDCDREDE
jgi:hypothetical protein